MQAGAYALFAEQHHAEESCLQKEGGEHFVAHQGADHGSGLVGKHAPVRAELVGHDDAGDDAHAEGHGENLFPVVEEIVEDLFLFPQPQAFQYGEIACKPNGKSGKDDVERHGECKLHPGESQCIEIKNHSTPLGVYRIYCAEPRRPCATATPDKVLFSTIFQQITPPASPDSA